MNGWVDKGWMDSWVDEWITGGWLGGWRDVWVVHGWLTGGLLEGEMGDWWMDQWKHNSMQILGKLCFREQGLRLTGVTFPTTKPPREGYETQDSPREGPMGRCELQGSQDSPALFNPGPGRWPTSASRSGMKCGLMVVVRSHRKDR